MQLAHIIIALEAINKCHLAKWLMSRHSHVWHVEVGAAVHVVGLLFFNFNCDP